MMYILYLLLLQPTHPTTPPTFTPEELFASFPTTQPPPTKPTLQDLIKNTDPTELRTLLINLGYQHATLGKHQDTSILPTTKITLPQSHTGEFCQTHIQTINIPPGTPFPTHSDLFIEEDSSITTITNKKGDPVTCSCDEFDCTCRKQCFCKTQSQPFPMNQPSTCPICKTCDGNVVPPDEDDDKKDDETSPDKPNPAPHEFKCTCSFDGAGGDDNSGGGTNSMDCDCKVSDCSCTRKCKCRAT